VHNLGKGVASRDGVQTKRGKLFFPAARRAATPLSAAFPSLPRSIMDSNTNISISHLPLLTMTCHHITTYTGKNCLILRMAPRGRGTFALGAMEILSWPPPPPAPHGLANGNPIPFAKKSVVSVGRMSTLAHLVPSSQPSPRRSGALGGASQPIAVLIDVVVEESARSHRSHSRAPIVRGLGRQITIRPLFSEVKAALSVEKPPSSSTWKRCKV